MTRSMSFCCGRGPYVIIVNCEPGGDTISVARAHPPFCVQLAVSDVCIGLDIRRGDEPPETQILDRALNSEQP